MADLDPILDDERWGSRQKLFVFLTALAIIFDGVDNQLIGIAVPALMNDWALPRGEFAPILASGMIGMMLGGAIAGIIGDRVGRKAALIGSMLVFSLLTAAGAIADSLWILAALRFLTGLGLGGALPNAAALASEYVPRRYRPFAVTLTIVCVPLGGTLAALLAGAVLPVLGWRWLFAIGGLLPLGAIAVLIRYLPESPRFLARHPERGAELERVLIRLGYRVPLARALVDPEEKAASHVSLSTLLTPDLRRDTLALWGAFFSCLLAVYTAFNWVPSVLTGSGLDITAASNGLAAFNLGGVAGAICGGLVIARLGSRPTLLGMSAGAIAGALGLSLAIGFWSDPGPIIALLGITGGLINAVQTTMYALAAHVYPTPVRATGIGTALAVGRSGGVLSTYAGAWALEMQGSGAFFGLMAAAMTMVLGCLAVVRRHIPRTLPSPTAGKP